MDKEKLSQKDYELINSYLDQELDRKDVLKFAERMAEAGADIVAAVVLGKTVPRKQEQE